MLILTSFKGIAQNFANKKFYLIDSLQLESLSASDKKMLDSCLTHFHKSSSDTQKINVLGYICENMMHDAWFNYQLVQYNLIKQALEEKNNTSTKVKLQKSLASALANIGYEYLMQGNLKKASNKYKASKLIAIEVNDKHTLATCYLSMAYIHNREGRVAKAIDLYDKGMSYCKEIGDKNGVANTLHNLAGIYSQQGDYDKALSFGFKSLEAYEIINDHRGIAYSLNSIGASFFKLKKYEKALKFYKSSIDIRKQIGDKYGLTDVYNNIGKLYEQKGDSVLALEFYNRSLAIQKEINYDGIALTLYNIGSLEFYQKDYKQAKKHLLESMGIANTNNNPDQIKTASALLARLYEYEGNYGDALTMYKLYIQMRDSLNNEATQKATAQQQAKYEYEKQKAIDDAEHEKQLAIEKEAKAKQQILTYATAGGLGLVGIFLIFVFNRLQVTRKQKNIIEEQKQEVEHQKETVEKAHSQLAEKNKEITDSIQYAKRIQSAILPPNKLVKEYLQESFILYKPKDIVAGDFYWLENKDNKVLFAAADCTGHGVPGAMVSVVCNNGLNRSVREYGLTDPGKILDKTREIVIQEFEKSEEEVKDGMDIALCSLTGNTLQYAGAHNPLWIIRPVTSSADKQYELIEIKANKQPIGKFDKPEPYTTHTVELQQGDSIYVFSDGYVDQFGGEKGKKFKAKAFRELLLSIQQKNMQQQKELIDAAFETWRGSLEQLDDVCVIGVKY